MKMILIIVVILISLFFVIRAQVHHNNSDRDNFEDAVAAFYAAIESGDKQAHAEMFADSAFMLPNHWEFSRGKEEITRIINAGENWVFQIKDLCHLEMEMSGDIGYTINDYYYTWHREGEEPDWHKTKNIHIWRKQKDGAWKLHADLWNSSEPLLEAVSE